MNDEINEKCLIEVDSEETKKKNEKYAIMLAFLVQLFWALNGLQLKSYVVLFPDAYSHHSLAFWRFLSMTGIGYYLVKKNKEEIIPIQEMTYKFWFFARNFNIYIGMILWVLMTNNLRLSTCQCIAGCHPILVLYMSIFFLKEKFYIRYLSGIFLCIIGTLLIVLNERSDTTSGNQKTSNVSMGVFIGIFHLISFSVATLAQKVLCNHHLSGDVQNFYMGFINTIVAFVFIVFEKYSGLSNLVYVAYCISNTVIFYLACYYSAECLKYIPVSKYIPITYMNIVYTFMIGSTILHEPIFLTDLIGSILIVSFQIYNVKVPLE